MKVSLLTKNFTKSGLYCTIRTKNHENHFHIHLKGPNFLKIQLFNKLLLPNNDYLTYFYVQCVKADDRYCYAKLNTRYYWRSKFELFEPKIRKSLRNTFYILGPSPSELRSIKANFERVFTETNNGTDASKASPRCLKITEKVSFNIASEASYVYILNGRKLIKNAKNGPIWRVLKI